MKIFIVILIAFSIGMYSYAGDTLSTTSGLKYIVLKKGKGKKSENGKIAEVHYTGWLSDGKKFDSSLDRGEKFEFTLGTGQVIKGWEEGIALMRIGDKFRLILPPELAYGERGAGDIIPPNSTLIFDVELYGIYKPKKSIVDTLMAVIIDNGIDEALDVYEDLKFYYTDKYNFKETQLNILGYQLLQIGMNRDAIEIFKLNVIEFPKSFNVYDSLGEAYMINGSKKLALENYELSLKLNPGNENAKIMIDSLKSNSK